MERIYENNRFNVLAPQSVTDAAVTSASLYKLKLMVEVVRS